MDQQQSSKGGDDASSVSELCHEPDAKFPRRELVVEPFASQMDLIEKTLIEVQHQPGMYVNQRRRKYYKGSHSNYAVEPSDRGHGSYHGYVSGGGSYRGSMSGGSGSQARNGYYKEFQTTNTLPTVFGEYRKEYSETTGGSSGSFGNYGTFGGVFASSETTPTKSEFVGTSASPTRFSMPQGIFKSGGNGSSTTVSSDGSEGASLANTTATSTVCSSNGSPFLSACLGGAVESSMFDPFKPVAFGDFKTGISAGSSANTIWRSTGGSDATVWG